MLPHTSLPNRSRHPRRAFNLRLCSAEGGELAELTSVPKVLEFQEYSATAY